MTKTPIKLGDSFAKETNRIHLRRLVPYLKKEYRTLDKKELTKIETLNELFGAEENDISKLKVVFDYQSIQDRCYL